MGLTTSILVRAQARGGKFLGPDIGYSYITVCDVASGRLLAQSVAAGDSGQLGPALVPNASSGVVLTQPLTPNWLSATSGDPSPTAGFLATFDLDRPALIEIAVMSTPNGIANQHKTSTRMWIYPGAQLTTEPGLILEVPGLNIQILTPSPAEPPPEGQTIAVTAWVTMMCGCKIADGTAWPTSEFQVSASLIASDGTTVSTSSLAIAMNNGQQVPSVFTSSLPYPKRPGEYQLIVSGVQSATANCGGSSLVLSL